jgi:predicted metal-binding membrane protein
MSEMTGGFIPTLIMWSVMMLAMMTPTALPVLLIFTRMGKGRGDPRAMRAGSMFAAGHLTIWIGFSVVAAALQWLLHRSMLLSSDMSLASSRISGIVLIGVGIYQLTPMKWKCLMRCQRPVDFLLTNWREGLQGAFQIGIRHGVYCLGCCWALMLVLFVVGVMNLAWVALITAFVFLEKFGPSGARIARVSGVLIILAGIYYGQA